MSISDTDQYANLKQPGTVMPTQGYQHGTAQIPRNNTSKNSTANSSASTRCRPITRLGLGGVAIGNGFTPTSDEAAQHTLQAAIDAGIRYFDTSPWYGLGLSERRFGHALHTLKAEHYTLSTKVGRVLTATHQIPDTMWTDPAPFDYRYDYSANGVRRSIEDSLQRLGVSQIDIVYIHDLSPDNEKDLGMPWEQRFEEAVKGAMPELSRMREEGIIKAWGFGVNSPEPVLKALEVADPDIFLLACQYSLLDHSRALHETLPKIAEKGASAVIGSPLLAGYLGGRERYLYDGTIPEWAPGKRARVQRVLDEYGIDLRTASLQFAEAHPAVAAIIPGARTAAQVEANVQSLGVEIPQSFWDELKSEKLIEIDAPVPRSRQGN
ncbi:aldo/keto reductase [Alkanindiges illinoisensis]|uniref:Aldo/keto reductase n=1 Tax=Alkanindiges illinoisensis TaxID=197183 RepID=A0A4Y7XDV0_9GAMM|nr:aldo/keto reductase [Alkanindiges illinoisensis]TEU29233.1 aldo/keto reductase [Alkanindiges illinoisensis]